MAKTKNDIKLVSTAGTGVFYVTKKNPKNTTKLELKKYDPRVRKPDISRAKQLLGWSPNVPRKDGLANVVQYFQKLGAVSL